MSHSHHFNNDNNKFFRDSTARKSEPGADYNLEKNGNRLEIPIVCKPMFTAHSDGSIIRNYEQSDSKQKNNHGKNLSANKDFNKIQNSFNPAKPVSNLALISSDLRNLNICAHVSEHENNELTLKKDKATSADCAATKTHGFPGQSQNRYYCSDGPYSDTFLGDSSVSSAIKNVIWDPWNKSERKNKKENKRRKNEKSPRSSRDSSNSKTCSLSMKSLDRTAGDETRNYAGKGFNVENSHDLYTNCDQTYQYAPYQYNKKSVEFVNEVAVIYFTKDEILTKVMEPLKKELDQQVRNKEMRRGHVPCTMIGKKQFKSENYMTAWFSKK